MSSHVFQNPKKIDSYGGKYFPHPSKTNRVYINREGRSYDSFLGNLQPTGKSILVDSDSGKEAYYEYEITHSPKIQVHHHPDNDLNSSHLQAIVDAAIERFKEHYDS